MPGPKGLPQLNSRLALYVKRGLILLMVVAVCAAVPLLINSRRSVPESSGVPSLLQQVAPPDLDENADLGPTDETVRELAATVAEAPRRGYDIPVSAAVGDVTTVPGPYRKLGRVKIAAIGLDTQYGEGVYEKTLDRGPGHWPGTPIPGSEGNAVLSGHRNTHTQPFKELDELRHGDKITVTAGDRSTTYRVTKTTIVPEAKFKDFVVDQPEGDGVREITLFACHPEGNPIYRIVVRGVADNLG